MLWSSVLPVNSVYGILWELLLCCWPLLLAAAAGRCCWPLLLAAAAGRCCWPLLLAAAAAAAAAVPGWSPAAPTAGPGPPPETCFDDSCFNNCSQIDFI